MQEVLKATFLGISGIRASRVAAILALAVGLMTADAGRSGNATPMPLAFDDTGTSTTTVNVTGASGGTMLFSLAVGGLLDLDSSNNFSLDVFNATGDVISSVNFLGLSQLAGSFDYGDATAPANSPLFDITFYDVMTWSVTVAPGDLSPLTLNIFSVLTPVSGPLNPLLTVDFTGDLQLPAAVPLPGALPLFLTGMGVLGLLGRRRKIGAHAQPHRTCEQREPQPKLLVDGITRRQWRKFARLEFVLAALIPPSRSKCRLGSMNAAPSRTVTINTRPMTIATALQDKFRASCRIRPHCSSGPLDRCHWSGSVAVQIVAMLSDIPWHQVLIRI